MERKSFGLTMADVMSLAYQLALRNGIKNQFYKRNEKAGRKWLKNFPRRHPQISVRTPEGISLSRARGFTPESVAQFFEIYEIAMEHKHTKIFGWKGKRQISSLQSTERGSLVTLVNCMRPIVRFIPPLLVFPRKNMKQELMNGTPPGSTHACHSSGWIESEIFFQWFIHFIKHTKPTKEDPVILEMDEHYSHTRNLEVITLARENHVDIICLPPHSNYKMQPLDKAFMGPPKYSIAKKLKNGSVHTQGESSPSTKLANCSEMHTSELQQAK